MALSEYSLASLVPNTICGGVPASPGQYSTPRVEGLPEGSWNAQISFPVAASIATTREYGVEMYMSPLMTSGVASLDANPEPPRPRPRPVGAGVGGAGVGDVAGGAGGFMR